jgi:hypothetical protein
MTKATEYQQALLGAKDVETYLLSKSGLPGPRSNLELLHVAAATCDETFLRKWLAMSKEEAPENTSQVYLQCIAIVSLGRFILQQEQQSDLTALRHFANDDRWRIRESVAMALQTIGKENTKVLAQITEPWLAVSLHELRAVAAAWAEPALLKSAFAQQTALTFMDKITQRFQQDKSDDKEARRILKKGLEYCWSVVVAANFTAGKPVFEKWFYSDANIQKIMLVNLTKKRLSKIAPDWVTMLQNKKGHFQA